MLVLKLSKLSAYIPSRKIFKIIIIENEAGGFTAKGFCVIQEI
jgi:hypothetical protein